MKYLSCGLGVSLLWGAMVAGAAFGTDEVTYKTEKTFHKIVRKGKNLAGAGEERITLRSKIYEETYKLVYVDVEGWDCEDDEVGDGRGEWKGFYTAPVNEKPARLVEAVQGLDLRDARWIVRNGKLETKPRSWNDFTRRIREASEDSGYFFAYSVLVTHKRDNMINLGYLIEGECRKVKRSEPHWVPQRKEAGEEVRHFLVRFTNAPLVTDRESDAVTLVFDGVRDYLDGARNGKLVASHNEYVITRRVENETVVYTLEGRRLAVRPANTLSVVGSVQDGKLSLSIVDEAFDPDLPGDRFVSGVVERSRSWDFRGPVMYGTFEIPLNRGDRKTDLTGLGIQVPPGKDFDVVFQLKVIGSPYYNNHASTSGTTRLRAP